MKKYKAIILVLASEDNERVPDSLRPFYPVLKKAYESYMFEHPDIKVLFVYGGATSFERKDYDLVYDHVPETYHPGMLTKTLLAIDHIHKNYEYDYIIRTNLSQFWIFDRLVKRLNLLPKEKCVTGTQITIRYKDSDRIYLQYTAGYDLHISRDLIPCLIDNREEIIKSKSLWNMEDHAICQALELYTGIKHNEFGLDNNGTFRGKLLLNSNNTLPETVDHIRFKIDFKRHEEIPLVQRLIKEHYSIDFNP